MAVQYAPLYSLEKQFVAKDGALNTAGFLRVYLAATDDPADTYSDYLGTRNPDKIILDDNGRAVVICDKSKAYRLEVYDADGMLLWTEEPVYCSGTGGGGVSVTEVVSTDGSIAVESSVAGSLRTYDLSIGPDNVRELLEWAKCYNTVEEDGVVYPLFSEGTMQTFAGQGLEVVQDRFYHLTNKITVIPSGNGINYETLTVQLVHDDGQGTAVALCTHDFDIDNSVSDKVELEFSEDIIPDVDGFLVWRVTNSAPFENVSLDLQIHRIFSGINSVPRSIASRTWVEENISSKIDYSALEYNNQNLITGISGSAIAANNVDPNEFVPWSASGVFQPSGDYLTASASSLFQPSGDYLSASESSNYYPMTGNPSGFIRDEECQSSYVAISSFSSYSADVESSITGISSFVSGLTGTYIEQSASSMFQPSGNYVSSTDMSAYVPFSGLEGDGTKITGISGSAIKGHEYTGVYPVNVDNVNDLIAVDHTGLAVDNETLSAFVSGDSIVLKVVDGIYQQSGDYLSASESSNYYPTSNPSGFLTGVDLSPYQKTADMSAYQLSGNYLSSTDSAEFVLTSQSGLFQPSGQYLSATESSNYYPSSNPSGFITGVDLSPYQLTADMSAYQPSGDYQTAGNYLSSTDSAEFLLTSQSGMFQPSGNYQPSGDYLSATESANYYPTSNPSGFLTGVDLTPYQLTADMSGYYTTANESGFVDSAYVEGQVSGKQDASAMTAYQEVSGMSAYQEVSGMTAYQPAGDYQPSGDYIYVSALGWAEV